MARAGKKYCSNCDAAFRHQDTERPTAPLASEMNAIGDQNEGLTLPSAGELPADGLSTLESLGDFYEMPTIGSGVRPAVSHKRSGAETVLPPPREALTGTHQSLPRSDPTLRRGITSSWPRE